MFSKQQHFLLYLLSSLVFISTIFSFDQIIITPDGEGYLETASQMASGKYWGKQSPNDLLNSASSIRTPLYPLLIFLTFKIFGAIPETLLYLHWLLAFLVTAHLIYAFRKLVPTSVSFLAVTFGIWISHYLAFAVLTEWVGFLLCIELYVLMFQAVNSEFLSYRFLIGITSTLLVLLKPVFLPAAALIIILTFLQSGIWKAKFLLVATFLVPLLLWSGFNWYRQSTFSLSPYGKFNLFGVAALCGNATSKSNDRPILKEFIEYSNINKFPPINEETLWLDNILLNYRKEKYDHNLWKVADKFRKERNLTRPEINTLCGEYSWRAIKSYPLNYLKYVMTGVLFAWIGYLCSFATIVLGLWTIRNYPKLISLSIASVVIAILYLITMTASIANITWLPRYEWMVGTPVEMALFILVFAILLAPRVAPQP